MGNEVDADWNETGDAVATNPGEKQQLSGVNPPMVLSRKPQPLVSKRSFSLHIAFFV